MRSSTDSRYDWRLIAFIILLFVIELVAYAVHAVSLHDHDWLYYITCSCILLIYILAALDAVLMAVRGQVSYARPGETVPLQLAVLNSVVLILQFAVFDIANVRNGSLLIHQGDEVSIRHYGPVWCYTRHCYRIPSNKAVVSSVLDAGPDGRGNRNYIHYTVQVQVCDGRKLLQAFGDEEDLRPGIQLTVRHALTGFEGNYFQRMGRLNDPNKEEQTDHLYQLLLEHTQPLAEKGICPLSLANWHVE